MKVTLAMVGKDLRLLVRDRTGFFFAFVFPLLMAVFFGAVFSGGESDESALAVDLVDEDQTEESRAFTATLVGSDDLAVVVAGDRETASSRVRRGKAIAFVVIPAGFAEARGRLFWGEPPTLTVGVDPARRAEAAMLEGILTGHLVEGFQKLLGDEQATKKIIERAGEDLAAVPGGAVLKEELAGLGRFLAVMDTGASTWSPARVTVEGVTRDGVQPPSYFAISFPQGIVWGLMMCAMTFGLSLVSERTAGTLMRLRVAPISRAHILAGKAGACFVLVMLIEVGLLGLGVLAFDLQIGTFHVLALAVLCAALCFVGVMMLLSVLGRTEKAASGYATAMMLLFMMIGGGMIPVFVMPSWMQSLSHLSPVKWAVLAIEGGTWRAFSASEVALPCAILVAVGAASFVVGARLFQDD